MCEPCSVVICGDCSTSVDDEGGVLDELASVISNDVTDNMGLAGQDITEMAAAELAALVEAFSGVVSEGE